MLFGREIHHKRDRGLVKDRTCSKCKTKFSRWSHFWGFSYYGVNTNKNKRKEKLQELIHSGELKNKFPKMGQAGMYATMMGHMLPKWPRWIRITVTLVVISAIANLVFGII